MIKNPGRSEPYRGLYLPVSPQETEGWPNQSKDPELKYTPLFPVELPRPGRLCNNAKKDQGPLVAWAKECIQSLDFMVGEGRAP